MIITVTSQKGGVGKTTTAVNLAHGLALAGQRVLLVDLDGQGQCSVALGRDPEPGLYLHCDQVVREPLANVLRETGRPGLWLLPGDSSTRRLERSAQAERDGFDSLVDRLTDAAGGYDVAVLDTAAGGLLQEVAIWLASVVVVPTRLEALAVDGVRATVTLAAKLGGTETLIQPVAHDRRLGEHGANLDTLRREFGAYVLPSVPARVAVPESHAAGMTCYECAAARLAGAADVVEVYERLVRDMVERCQVAEAEAMQ